MDTYISSRRGLALRSLERDGWLEVEFLETQLGPEVLAKAFGYTDSYVSANAKFTPNELKKLRLIGRVFAGISQLYDRSVVKNWLYGMNPYLGELSPLQVMATMQMHGRRLSWMQVEDAVMDAAKKFLEAS